MNQFLRFLSGWFAVLTCLGLLGVAGPSFAESEDPLVPGDNIRVTVFENPDLTTESRVSARGTIRFPLIGNVKLGGLTPTVAAELIRMQLKEGNFIRQPEVNISVIQGRSRQVSVLGQVARPGRYALDEGGARLTDILALAGGISPAGDDVVTLIRIRDGKTDKLDVNIQKMYQSGDFSANVEVDNGDTVFVKRAPVFYIYGEVQRAGAYRLEPETNVMRAISVGGGITVRGTERGLKVGRHLPDGGLSKVSVQLGDLVKPDDIIYVSESLF
jgi:polysaccharide export outer membrane protein